MKLKLDLHNRLILLSLLPSENDFSTLRIIRKVSKDVGLTEKEYKEYGVKKLEGGRISFDPIKSQEEKEFDIGEVAIHLVKEALKKLDTEKKLTQEHLPIYEKIMKDE